MEEGQGQGQVGKMKGFVENMSEKFEFLETQKKSLRKSVFSVFFEWKGFEEQIVKIQNCFRQGLSELESKEKELRSVQDSLSQVVKELDSERDSLRKKVQQVEDKEKELKLFSDRGILKLNKEREDFIKEVEFREAKILEREKRLEDLLKKQDTQKDEISDLLKKQDTQKNEISELLKKQDAQKHEISELLKKQDAQKNEISESTKEMERRRVEIEGNIMKLNKESEGFLMEIELRKDEISESMKEMERRRVEIEGKEELVMKREKKVEAKENELELLIEREREVDLKVKDLDLMIEDIVIKEKDVELIRDLNEKRSKELDMREKQLGAKVKDVESMNKKLSKELDMWEKQSCAKVKDVELFRDSNEKRSKELDMREKQLGTKAKDVELIRDMNERRSKELDMREKQSGAKVKDVELVRDLNEKRSKELDAWEKQLGMKVKDVELIRDKNEGRSIELDMREEQLVEKLKDVELIRDLIEGRSKELDMREEQLGAKVKDVELIRDLNEERLKELDMREKQLCAKVKDVELIRDLDEGRSKELDMREKQLGTKDTQLQMLLQKVEEQFNNLLEKNGGIVLKRSEDHVRRLETEPKEKEVHLDGQMNQLNDGHHASVKEPAAAEEPKERQGHKRIHEEKCNENHLKKKGSHLEKELSVKKKSPSLVGKGIREEGYDLYRFLQDHGKELNKVVDHAIKTIQQSKEPAKLVLTAIEEFYNRVISEKETEVKKDIAFRNCILLLEQLMKLSVDSHLSSVKDEALKFAGVWRTNMKIRDSFEVLGFLYLLASYKLTNEFPMHAVIRFLEAVAPRRKTRDLCRHLDLKNNIHDFIAELIKKNRILLAFDYVHELELVDEFPPVALLKEHVLSSSMEAKKLVNKGGKKGKRNHEAQDRALSFEISALNDVMRCIMRRNLQADYPPDELKERIELLERQRESLKASSRANQKVDSYGSGNTQHANCPSKKKQKKRHLDLGGGYNMSELPPPSKCPRHVPPAEVHHPEGHQAGNPSSRHPDDTTFHTDAYSPWQKQQQHHNEPHSPRLQQQQQQQHHTDSCSPRWQQPQQQQHHQQHHAGPYSPRWQQPQQQHQQHHTDSYSSRWRQQQQQQQQQQHNQSDPPCHVNGLVGKYLTAGNRELVYPAHQFSYVKQPPPLQPVIMAPDQPFYPAHPRYI